MAVERDQHCSHQRDHAANRERVWPTVPNCRRYLAPQRVCPNSCVLLPGVLAALTLSRPAGFDGSAVLNAVRGYWQSSYYSIRASSANTLQLIHDAFQPLSYWNGWEQPPAYQGVAMDTHIYQMFSNAVSPFVRFRPRASGLLTGWTSRASRSLIPSTYLPRAATREASRPSMRTSCSPS